MCFILLNFTVMGDSCWSALTILSKFSIISEALVQYFASCGNSATTVFPLSEAQRCRQTTCTRTLFSSSSISMEMVDTSQMVHTDNPSNSNTLKEQSVSINVSCICFPFCSSGVYAPSSRGSGKWGKCWQWGAQVAIQLCGVFIVQLPSAGSQTSRFPHSQAECREIERLQNQVMI